MSRHMRTHELEEARGGSVIGEDGDSTPTPTPITPSAPSGANATQQNMPMMHMTGQVNKLIRFYDML